MSGIGRVAGLVGRGLAAGAVGTAAMTASSTLEAKLRERSPSSAPADAAEKVLGVEPVDEESEARLSNAVHWAYGTGWGAARGILAAMGLRGVEATGTHLALVWGSALTMLPKLGVAPPPQEWGPKELGIDLMHHAVYATATGLTFAALTRR